MQNERKRLTKLQSDLTQKIHALPEGNLFFSKNGKYLKYYKSNGSNPIYIPKKSRSLAEALAAKKYYMLKLEEVTYHLNLILHFLKDYQTHPIKSSELLSDSSYHKDLLQSYFHTFPPKSTQWMNAEYNRNTNHPEYLLHKTLAGHYVRSKSEVIIANTLFINKIPYRYECELTLKGVHLYPDFTILHPSEHKILYWEHFGLMSNNDYQEKAFHKLKVYGTNGIIPTIHLITTYETNETPIDSANIQKIVEEYFL